MKPMERKVFPSVPSALLQAKRSSRPEGPILEGSAPIACPVGKNDRIGVKCLPYGMRSLFHRGEVLLTGHLRRRG